MSQSTSRTSNFGVRPQLQLLEHTVKSRQIDIGEVKDQLDDVNDIVSSQVIMLKTHRRDIDQIHNTLQDLKSEQYALYGSLNNKVNVITEKVNAPSENVALEAKQQEVMNMIIGLEHKVSYVRSEASNSLQAVRDTDLKPIQETLSSIQKQQAFMMDFMRTVEATVLDLKTTLHKVVTQLEPTSSTD